MEAASSHLIFSTNFFPAGRSRYDKNGMSRFALTRTWLIRYQVIVSVRSVAKGDGIISALPEELKGNVSYEVVEDIAKENAFDEVWSSLLET